jgi:hypothetical protein
VTDSARPGRPPTVLWVTLGLLLVSAALITIGLLALPSLMFSKVEPVEPVLATESNARTLAAQLSHPMTDQEIADAVARQPGATVVEVRHEPGTTAVLVSVPDSIVEPKAHACYLFTLREGTVSHDEATGCPDVP